MKKELSEGDGIHVRAVRYGYIHNNGFMYKDVEKWYSKRTENDWPIVKKFLNDAFDNFTRGLNRETPYILLEQLGNNSADESRYTLSYHAYIQYFEYEQLQQAKKDTKLSQRLSWIAIVVALLTLIVSIHYSNKQINSFIKIDPNQYQNVLQAIKSNQIPF